MSPPGFNRMHAAQWCFIYASLNLLNAVTVTIEWVSAICYAVAIYCCAVGVLHVLGHWKR